LIIYGLFSIKDKVGNLNYQLQEVNRQISREEDMIHILKAEFAYLTSPQRLQKLSNNYLGLTNVKTSQLINDPLLQDNTKQVEQIATISISKGNIRVQSFGNNNKHNVRWRYKKMPGKYLQTAYNNR
jgi:hypothetical protein